MEPVGMTDVHVQDETRVPSGFKIGVKQLQTSF